jgi:Family of unknown function (DUF6807)
MPKVAVSRLAVLAVLTAAMFVPTAKLQAAKTSGVQVVPNEAQRRVDITIDGRRFTSYIWPTTLKKPVLYPLITDEDITVTRGYPLDPRPHERVDHPHHAGMWFNYSNVNGFDFWNNSDAIKPERAPKMGTILETKIVSTQSGANHGELVVDSVWVTGHGDRIIDQTTRYVFSRRPHDHARVIDQIITLRALDRVVFNDDKDGLLGLRVASWLESPDEKGGIFLDSSGHPTKVAAAPNSDATGVYLTSEGIKGGAAWGTRGKWCSLTGHDPDHHTVTIVILDHPLNPGYPTYWHARGYGLFAANPLGRSIFDPKQPPFNYTLEKGQTATFRYRVLLISHEASAESLNHEADQFAAEYR